MMDKNLEEAKIHELLTEKGQIRFDGKPLVRNY